MNEDVPALNVLLSATGCGIGGRPPLRGKHQVEADLRSRGFSNWRQSANRRNYQSAILGGQTRSNRYAPFKLERLRLKIIERLLKEGSNAEEPLNIQLSDYSSDEGGVSSSENECRGSSFSDLEGPCCALSRAPPSTPEAEAQHRRHKLSLMRRVMHELDRIYFQPLFQKKFRCFMRYKRTNPKRASEKNSKNKCTSGSDVVIKPQNRRLQGGDEWCNSYNRQDNVCGDIFPDALKGSSGENVMVRYPGSIHKSKDRVFLSAEGGTDDSKIDCRKVSRKSHTIGRKRHKEAPINKGPPQSQHFTVSRKLRMWLADRKIFILRSKRKHRKPRTRRSHSNRKCDTRIALDLPTTDPSADLIFFTDEEPNTRDDDNYLPQYCTVPRARARRLLQSELQRRYIEEIGDNEIGRNGKRMPPELIITSPSKGTYVTIRPNVEPSQVLPDPLSALEFPMHFKPSRRTNSWHNLNNGTFKSLCLVRQNSRAPNTYNTNESKLDELDIKLSLKKYWAGVKIEGSKNSLRQQRPLSWNQQLRCQHHSREQPTKITYCRLSKPSCGKLEQQTLKKDDQEIFLNACSQKLIHWQKEINKRGKYMVTNDPNTSPTNAPKIGIDMKALALGMPEIIQDKRALCIFRKICQVTNELKAPSREGTEFLESKSKRRSNRTKIADTSQLITRLANTKPNTRNGHDQLTVTSTSSVVLHKHKGLFSSTSKGKVQGSNRFKTGGYVVTAVQQSSKKKVKKLHHNNNSQVSFGGSTGGACKKDKKNNGGVGTAIGKTNLTIKSTLGSNTFVRKLKAKKSNHPRDNPSNMTSNNRNLGNVNNVTNNSIYGVSLLSRKM